MNQMRVNAIFALSVWLLLFSLLKEFMHFKLLLLLLIDFEMITTAVTFIIYIYGARLLMCFIAVESV